eukprot:5770150-Pleurochrysis_carterae.AAC.1
MPASKYPALSAARSPPSPSSPVELPAARIACAAGSVRLQAAAVFDLDVAGDSDLEVCAEAR